MSERPLITADDLRRSAAAPRARWRLFGVTQRDLDRAKARLIAVLEDPRRG